MPVFNEENKQLDDCFESFIPEEIRSVLEETGLLSYIDKRNYCLCLTIDRKIALGYNFNGAIGVSLKELRLQLSSRQVRNIVDEGRKRGFKLLETETV